MSELCVSIHRDAVQSVRKRPICGNDLTAHLAVVFLCFVESWPSARPGMLSTAGTTASLAIVRGSSLYIGHLGDSGIVLGRDEGVRDAHGQRRLSAVRLTVDHKPELESEKSRIEALGGEVKPGNGGVLRVVWNRVRQPHTGPVLRSTEREQVPFLSVSRSLGDLWSYDFERKDYLVSPVPDVSVRTIDVKRDRFVILGSDGLWGVVSPEDAVQFVEKYKGEGNDDVCHALIVECLHRWRARRLRADNISVVILYFHEPIRCPEFKPVALDSSNEWTDAGTTSCIGGRKRVAEVSDAVGLESKRTRNDASDVESSPSDSENN